MSTSDNFNSLRPFFLFAAAAMAGRAPVVEDVSLEAEEELGLARPAAR